jgi:hypothetical protein
MHSDSISIDDVVEKKHKPKNDDSGDDDVEDKRAPILNLGNVKLIIMLFLWFIFIVSDIFRDSILSEIGPQTLKGREITSWGIVVQGIFLIIGYILLVYLTEHEIL